MYPAPAGNAFVRVVSEKPRRRCGNVRGTERASVPCLAIEMLIGGRTEGWVGGGGKGVLISPTEPIRRRLRLLPRVVRCACGSPIGEEYGEAEWAGEETPASAVIRLDNCDLVKHSERGHLVRDVLARKVLRVRVCTHRTIFAWRLARAGA